MNCAKTRIYLRNNTVDLRFSIGALNPHGSGQRAMLPNAKKHEIENFAVRGKGDVEGLGYQNHPFHMPL